MVTIFRVFLHLLSPRARWTSVVLISAIFVTLNWILPFLDEHYPIEERIMAWPSAGLSRVVGSKDTVSLKHSHSSSSRHKEVAFKSASNVVAKRNLTSVLNGPPMEFFRDNLRNDTYYLTTWTMAGFTNEFINYVNMIYLATLTDRIPIVPPFAPDHHIPTSAGILPFGDAFDLDILSDRLRMPVLEWRDLKILPDALDRNPYGFVDHPKHNEPISEPIGCWSTRAPNNGEPIRAENVIHHIGVDPAYTRVPFYTRLTDDAGELNMVFSRLAALIYRSATFSSARRSKIAPSWEHWGDPEKEPDRFEHMAPSIGGHHRRPESHLSCFDTLYYMTSGAEALEWRLGFSPVWRTVGRWVRFSERTHEIVKEYVDGLFGESLRPIEGEVHIYPFISVHIRRGDFEVYCDDGHCYPPLSVYARHVEEVKKEIYERRGITVEHVVVSANEEAAEFWEEIETLGWLRIDHKGHRTVERYGMWHPVLIDVVVQSYGLGMVGTEDSTLSLVSQLRVLDWNKGVASSVNMREK